ncbi:MAG: right-handed parallel beta-helix repeat-containing protein [Desulfobulbaceae bacterium]|nr:right-handed parallel beta-helix repeat-containing protein [Desulfobulbaceae bacterium]
MTIRSYLIWLSLLAWLGIPSSLMASPQTPIGNVVLTEDTVWSGTITIDGVVVVGRKATLTITPGTTILFKRRDVNHDGVGDSEIRVLGGVIAQGSAKQPIVFKSAETKPAPKDWSYLLIFTSGKKNRIEYCQFHDAFSGLQVHFSTALVQDCLFSHNLEGIRFGRAKLTLRHCLINENHIGVRFTRMEGPVEIQYNEINNNQVGIFLVPSGQNIVDFFEPGRTGKPWNEGHLDISANNIRMNSDYNLKLGAKQLWDLKITNNWWGIVTRADIRQTLFDQHRDPDLGRAIIEPTAPQTIVDAGIRQLPANHHATK